MKFRLHCLVTREPYFQQENKHEQLQSYNQPQYKRESSQNSKKADIRYLLDNMGVSFIDPQNISPNLR